MQTNLQAWLAFRCFVRYKILGLADKSSTDGGVKFKKFALTRIKSMNKTRTKINLKRCAFMQKNAHFK